MKEKNIGSVIILLTPQANTEVEETAKVIADAQAEFITPFFPIFMGEKSVGNSHIFFEEKQIVSFATYDFLPRALGEIINYRHYCEQTVIYPHQHVDENREVERAVITAKEKKIKVLNFSDSLSILRTYGINTCTTTTVYSLREIDGMTGISYPVVAKLFSEKITHKTDVKGVYINLQNKEELKQAYTKIMQIPGADGCIIQPMMKGYELIVGAKRDTTFGPIVAIGLGGVLTELISDPLLMIYPFTFEQFSRQVNRKKWSALFDGFRGESRVDIKKLYSVAYGIGELMQSSSTITEIDINPLIMSTGGFFAVDIRIVI